MALLPASSLFSVPLLLLRRPAPAAFWPSVCILSSLRLSWLAAFHKRPEEFAAYVVEACRTCTWHHLLRVLPLGGRTGRRRPTGPAAGAATATDGGAAAR